MMTCTQPGCTGRIVDGYCDVCGSPAGAVPFVPAAASAASPAPADELGLMAVPASTPDPAPVNEEMPPPRVPPVEMPRQRLSTQQMADPGTADPVAVDTQKVDGEKELAEGDPDGAQDYRTRVEEARLPGDVRKAALGEVGKLERTSAQSPETRDIRAWLDTILDLPWSTKITDSIDIQGSREVEATLRRLIEPVAADVEEGATAEPEPAVADVDEGIPTLFDLRWSPETTNSIDIQGSREEEAATAEAEPAVADVEEGATAEAEPAVADVEEGATAEAEPAVADVEEGATAEPAGPQHDDKVKMPAVPAISSGGRQQRPQLPEQQVLGPEPVQTPAEKRRFGSLALAATALAALLVGALLFAASRDRGVTAQSVPTVTASATATVTKPTSGPSNQSTDTGGEEPTIQLEVLADSARPFQAVRIEGRYRGGADTFLRVQRWEGGKWLAFPIPTKTDQSGRFTTHVEFDQPGRYQLRVLDPNSGVTSKLFLLVIKG
jgi:hypothetical protein